MQEKGLKVDLLLIIDASALTVRYRWLWSLIAFLGSGLRLNHGTLIDGFSFTRRMMIARQELSRRMMIAWQKLSRQGKRAALHYVIGRLSEMFKQRFMPAHRGPYVEAAICRRLDQQERTRAYRHAMRGYIPGPYSGRVVLLRTNDMQSRAPDDPTVGWRDVASHLEVCPIPGGHQTSVTEHVESLAACLATYLRDLS